MKIFGCGLCAIARIFGTSGYPERVLADAAKLAQAIYLNQQDDPAILTILKQDPLDKLPPDEQKKEIEKEFKSQYPTPTNFLNLPSLQKSQIKIHGRGLKAIATILGITGNLTHNMSLALKLAEVIYQNHEEEIRK